MKIAALIIALLVLLCCRFYLFYQTQPVYHDGQQGKFTAILQEEPEFVYGRQQFRVTTPDGLRVRIVASSATLYNSGDRLFIEGIFTKSEYKGRTFWVMHFPNLQMADKEHNIITDSSFYLKKKAKTIYESVLSPNSASLLSGMIFGGNHGLEKGFLENLRSVGVLHVIAASGMNVSFVAGALLSILGTCLKRPLALVLGSIGVIFYAFLAGLEPAIVRATIMALIAFSASLLGRQNLAVLALFLTGYGMLLFDPKLLFDVGFQLSLVATLGILLIKPLLPLGKPFVFTEDVATTLAAQIATTPFLLTNFGQYGLLSVIANAFILWTVPIVMFFGAVGLLIGLVFEPVGKLVVLCSLPFLLFFEWVVTFFGSMHWSLQMESFPLSLSVGYYLLLVSAVLFFQKKGKHDKKKERGLREEIGI